SRLSMVSRRPVGVAGSFFGQLSFKYWIARCDAVLRPLNLLRCASLRDKVCSIRSALHDPRPAGPAPQERSPAPGRGIAGPRTVGCAGAPPRWEDCATAGATAMMDETTTPLRSADASLSRIVISDPALSNSILLPSRGYTAPFLREAADWYDVVALAGSGPERAMTVWGQCDRRMMCKTRSR